jgi:DNA polymerase sigma
MIVKLWAKRRGVNNPKNATLTSYAWVILVIFFLQNTYPAVLPILNPNTLQHYYYNNSSNSNINNNNTVINTNQKWCSRNNDTTLQLLLKFFMFYSSSTLIHIDEKKENTTNIETIDLLDYVLSIRVMLGTFHTKKTFGNEINNDNSFISNNNNNFTKTNNNNKNTERLTTKTVENRVAAIDDENDDLQREMAFYNHSLTAAKDGRRQLTSLNVPVDRPLDYFCESLKSDAHMARIKVRLMTEEKKMAAFEERKQRDINKKFNKQVAALKKSNKTQTTKQFNEDVTNLRKDSKSGDSKEEKLNKILTGSGRSSDGTGKSKKRLGYDKKYGHGGKESKSKKSTSKSINDLSDYNPRGGKFVRREDHNFKKGKGSKGGKGNRPGKSTRDKKRSEK